MLPALSCLLDLSNILLAALSEPSSRIDRAVLLGLKGADLFHHVRQFEQRGLHRLSGFFVRRSVAREICPVSPGY